MLYLKLIAYGRPHLDLRSSRAGSTSGNTASVAITSSPWLFLRPLPTSFWYPQYLSSFFLSWRPLFLFPPVGFLVRAYLLSNIYYLLGLSVIYYFIDLVAALSDDRMLVAIGKVFEMKLQSILETVQSLKETNVKLAGELVDVRRELIPVNS